MVKDFLRYRTYHRTSCITDETVDERKEDVMKIFSLISAVPKSTSSGVVTGSSGTGNMTGGGAAGSMTPMLSHQYIMGQGVPYAFQQPMYSYEELQLVQQRIPHMVSSLLD